MEEKKNEDSVMRSSKPHGENPGREVWDSHRLRKAQDSNDTRIVSDNTRARPAVATQQGNVSNSETISISTSTVKGSTHREVGPKRGGRDNKRLPGKRIIASLHDTVDKQQGHIDALRELLADTLVSKDHKEPVSEIKTIIPSPEAKNTQADWVKFEQEIMYLSFKFRGEKDRYKKILVNVNYLINKYNIREIDDWSNRVDVAVHKAAYSYKDPITYWTRRNGDWQHDNHGTIWSHIWNNWIRLPGFDSLKCRVTQRIVIHNTCCDGVPAHELHPKAIIDITNVNVKCEPSTFRIGITASYPNIVIYRSCWHNEYVALTTRQLIAPIGTSEERATSWAEAFKLFRVTDQWKAVPNFRTLTEADMEAFLSRYPVNRRNTLKKELAQYGRLDINTKTKAFVKSNEWNIVTTPGKMNPRCISGKDDNLLLSSVAYWIWTKESIHVFHNLDFGTTYTYGAGLTVVEIGNWYGMYFGAGWKIYRGDFRRMDGHTEIEPLTYEHTLYAEKQIPPDLYISLMDASCNCGGYTKNGIKYSCEGKRCSGIISTSYGTTLNVFMIYSLLLAGIKFAILATGDDHIIATPEELDLPQIYSNANKLGHSVELDLCGEFDAEFCSARFVEVSAGKYVLCPKLGRFFAKGLMPHKYVPEHYMASYMKSNVEGLYNYRFLPGLDVIVKQLNITKKTNENTPEWKFKDEEVEVDQAYVDAWFENFYGIPANDFRTMIASVDWSKPGQCLTHYLFNRVCEYDGMEQTMNWFWF